MCKWPQALNTERIQGRAHSRCKGLGRERPCKDQLEAGGPVWFSGDEVVGGGEGGTTEQGPGSEMSRMPDQGLEDNGAMACFKEEQEVLSGLRRLS